MEDNVITTGIVEQKSANANIANINTVNLLDENQLNAAKAFMLQVIRSKKSGITSIEDGLAILMRAQDLNLPFSACIEHIHIINGKTGVDVHILKSLLLRAGVTYRLVNDYTPLYEYTDNFQTYIENKLPVNAVKCKNRKEAEDKAKDDTDNIFVYPVRFYKDFNGNTYKEYQLNSKAVVVANQQQAKQVIEQGKLPVYRIAAIPVDYITTYEFKRYIVSHGHEQEITHVSHFSYSDAVQAGFLEKETYQKYLRVMIGHRAFTLGAREIAADIVMGCMELTELKQVNHIDIEDGDVIEIQ